MGNVLTISAPLTHAERRRIFRRFPPVHPNLFGRYVTMAYRDVSGLAPSPVPVIAIVTGEVVTARFQALALGISGGGYRPDGRPWHITLSTADGVAPGEAQHFEIENVAPIKDGGFPLMLSLTFDLRAARYTPLERRNVPGTSLRA